MVNSSDVRRESLFNRLKSKDITISEALTYDSNQWYQSGLSTKKLAKASLEGAKNLLKQIPDNKEAVVKYHTEKNKITDKDYIDFLEKKVDKLIEKTPVKKQLEKIETTLYIPDIKYPTKRGEYGLVLVKDFDNKRDFWIKYKDKKELSERLDKLEKDSLEQNFWIIFYGFGVYREFVDTEFDKLLAEI